jgi:hypothetical protein
MSRPTAVRDESSLACWDRLSDLSNGDGQWWPFDQQMSTNGGLMTRGGSGPAHRDRPSDLPLYHGQ